MKLLIEASAKSMLEIGRQRIGKLKRRIDMDTSCCDQ
jgi:hypothetical protein